MNTNLKEVLQSIAGQIKFATVEFAGVKFKVNAKSGTDYLHTVQNNVIKPTLYQYQHLKRMVICEEKYKFTPDTFKAATHEQRKTKKKTSIAHLEEGTAMISTHKYGLLTVTAISCSAI